MRAIFCWPWWGLRGFLPTEHFEASSRPRATAQVNINQGIADIPKGMVIQKKTLNLLALLESQVGGATTEVPADPRPPTPLPAQSFPTEPKEKEER